MSVWRYACFFLLFLGIGFGLCAPEVCAQPLSVIGEQLRDGQQHYTAGRYALAYERLSDLALRFPSAPEQLEVQFWKARAAIAMRHPLAEHEARQFLSRFPTSAEAPVLLRELGNHFFERTDGNYKRKALHYYTRLLPTATPRTEAEAKLGLRYGLALQATLHTAYFNPRTKNRENPLHFFDGIKVTRFPQAREARYRAGMIRMEGKRYDEGTRDLKKYLADCGLEAVARKQYQNAVTVLLTHYTERGDKVAAEKLLALFEKLPPDKRPDVYLLHRARQAYEKQRVETFYYYINIYFQRNARLTKPDSLYLVAGYAQAISEQPQEALTTWGKVVKPSIKNGDVLAYDMGVAYLHLKDYESADAQFAKLIENEQLRGENRELHHAALRISIRLAANAERVELIDKRTRKYLELYGGDTRDIEGVLDDCITTLCRAGEWEKGKALLDWYEGLEGRTKPIIEEYRQFLYLESGKYAYQQGNYEQALRKWTQGLRHNASASYTYRITFWTAQAYLKLGEPSMAKERLTAIPERSRVGWKAQYLLGYIFFNEENYQEAGRAFQFVAYQQYAEEDYKNNAHLRMADCKAALGYHQAAIRAYKEVFSKIPEEQDYITFQLGYVYQTDNDLSKAANYFQRVIREYPSSPHRARAIFYLGVLYEEMYRPEKAIETYRYLLTELPDNIYVSEVLYRKGNMHQYLDQVTDAIGMYTRLIREYPANQHAYDALVALREFRAEGWDVPNLAALERTFRASNPQHIDDYRIEQELDRVLKLIVRQDNAPAISNLRRLAAENPLEETRYHNRYFFLLGLAHEQRGDTLQAHQHYDRLYTKIDVEYARRAWKQQFPLYHAAGAYAKEAEVLVKLVEIVTDKSRLTRYLERLSNLYLRLQRFEEAEAVLQRMESLKLDNAAFRQSLREQIAEKKSNKKLNFTNK